MMLVRNSFFHTVLLFGLLSFPLKAQERQYDSDQLKADNLYYDAVKARMLGDDKKEEALLLQVVKLKPEEAAVYYDLTRLNLKKSNTKQAEDYIKQAIKLDPGNLWYEQQYAEVMVYENKFEEAAKLYEKLAGKEKINEELLFKGAMLYQRSGKYKEAIALLDRLQEQSDDPEEVLIPKQQLYLRMNDVDGAVKVAKELIADNPKEGKYYANLADLYNSNNQPDKALEIYRKALAEFPNNGSIQYGVAEYYQKQGDTVKYDEYMRMAILNPEFDEETQTVILRAYLDEVSQDPVRKEKGTRLSQELAVMHPDNPQVISLYGQVLSRNNEPEKAAVQFKKALEMEPSRFNIWQELLQLYLNAADADSLILYSKKAMRYFPNQAIIHYLNGAGYFNKKDYPAAIKSYNRAIELQPEENALLLADMYSSLGDAFNIVKEYALSDSAYEHALKLNRNNPTVLNNYSYYLSLRGVRLDDAEKMSKHSLELRPGEATFLDTYAWILYKQGKFEDAKEYLEKAIQQNPNSTDGTMWEHLGDVYYRLNNLDKAVENWKIAKQKGTDNQQIDKKIQDKKIYE